MEPVGAAVQGDQSCDRAGCGGTDAAPCRFVDRRGQACATAWCPEHQVVVHGRAYCPRHGGVVDAVVSGGMVSAPLPDVGNRAPSLACLVSAAVGPAIADVLGSEWPSGFAVGTTAVQLSYVGVERRRVWGRKWTVHSHRGDEVVVVLGVTEERPEVVTLRVDSDTVAELVPPWIDERPRSGADCETSRAAFSVELAATARTAVVAAHAAELALEDRRAQSWQAGEQPR